MAIAPSLTEILGTEVVATLPALGRYAHDNFFRVDSAIIKRFMEDNAVVSRGGRDIREPLIFQSHSNVKRLDGPMASAPLMGFDPAMHARDVWRGYGQILVISEDELEDNSGPEQVLDIFKLKRDVSVKQMVKEVNSDLLSVTSDVPDGINSLLYHISDTPATAPVLHGIDPASYSFWRNIQVTGGSFASGVGEGALIQADIDAARSQGVDLVKWLISSPTDYRNWKKTLIPMQEVIVVEKSGEVATPKGRKFEDKIWLWDPAITVSGRVWGVNPDYVKLYTKGRTMTFSKPVDVADQWFMAWKMKIRIQLMFLSLARHFVCTSMSA